jgi:predicted acetyltransferase
MTDITLIRPSLDWLPFYARALEQGWSPNTDQDVSREQLLQFRRAPERFLHDLYNSPMVRLPDGREVPRLPAHDFWISDGEFCGRIGFRFQRGTEDMPTAIYGHIGYTIVPWKQRRGYATQALRMILPVCRPGADHLRRRQRGFAKGDPRQWGRARGLSPAQPPPRSCQADVLGADGLTWKRMGAGAPKRPTRRI